MDDGLVEDVEYGRAVAGQSAIDNVHAVTLLGRSEVMLPSTTFDLYYPSRLGGEVRYSGIIC